MSATPPEADRKSTRLNSSHGSISYAVFCLKKKKLASRRSIPCMNGMLKIAPPICSRYVLINRHRVVFGGLSGMDSNRCLTDFFFFNDTATTEIYTLSLHDALPI